MTTWMSTIGIIRFEENEAWQRLKINGVMLNWYVGRVSHPTMCDNRLGNMYNLRQNMANSTGE
ncbi:Protein of unknown function [Pyronema omphalodes CBS 100304]|uniref:Uncharacterized protein n=1 Tax=Pyronema omphalodes (strain CBS 100304) TaxID=1076935 RepID=U4LSM5_PYROM|nr:Protein of unknown function [Pyronema omphalodes CBS 100304]